MTGHRLASTPTVASMRPVLDPANLPWNLKAYFATLARAPSFAPT